VACGHVTIAIASALAELGIWRWGHEVTVRSLGGEFPLRLRDGQVEMDQRQQFAARAAVNWSDVTAALGHVRGHSDLPLEVGGTGLRRLIVPAADVAALSELTLDGARIAALAARAAGRHDLRLGRDTRGRSVPCPRPLRGDRCGRGTRIRNDSGDARPLSLSS
jgi:predicted PhzF superfamily epimerase YddE/YHI9